MAISTYTGSIPSTIKKNKNWTLWSSAKASTVSGGTSLSTRPMSKIKYNNGLYYFINNNGFVYYSSDAKTWSVSSRISAVTGWSDIAYNGTIWVASGDNTSTKFFSSTDLATWTARTSNISTTGQIFQVDWIPAFSRFITVGNGNAAPWNCISSSTDGITWTSANVVPNAGADSTVWGFAYDGTGTVFATGNNATNNGYYTTNGTSWTVTNSNNSNLSSYRPIWIGGNVNRFSNGTYSQTTAAIGTAWNTAPYVSYANLHNYHRGLVDTAQHFTRADLILNTTDNVLYAFQNYGTTNAGINLPELKTLDVANPIVQTFTTGTSTEYTLPMLWLETLPGFSLNRASLMSDTSTALGWGNGILVYVTQQFDVMNIWSTAT